MYNNKNEKFNDRKKNFDGHKEDVTQEKDVIFGRNSVNKILAVIKAKIHISFAETV